MFNVLANHKASGVIIPQDMVVKWLYQTCRGLEAIHAAKTIHRDIKVRVENDTICSMTLEVGIRYKVVVSVICSRYEKVIPKVISAK